MGVSVYGASFLFMLGVAAASAIPLNLPRFLVGVVFDALVGAFAIVVLYGGNDGNGTAGAAGGSRPLSPRLSRSISPRSG